MIITRQWAMPNKNTFSIKPIMNALTKYFKTRNINGIGIKLLLVLYEDYIMIPCVNAEQNKRK